MNVFVRKRELKTLEGFAASQKSEWLYVRGRRRVGKTWLLREFQTASPKRRFYFAGTKGTRLGIKLRNFVKEWDRFTGQSHLSNLLASALDWPLIFREIGLYAKKRKASLVLIFDEIQWLASDGDSFAGDLKTAWAEWQKEGRIKTIVCGSSSKFFKQNTGGADKVLRGLQTLPHLRVLPLTPSQAREHCFKKWPLEESALAYMMTGGIPYYLERINPQKGFVHAVNDAFFTTRQHLLDEADELLNYDFNAAGMKTVKKILAALGQDGCLESNIVFKTGLPLATARDLLARLVDYDIVFEKQALSSQNKVNRSGIKYFMKDFFLNFYFQILRKSAEQIRANESSLIFPNETSLSLKGYYIPNFSGKAFELFVRYLFESRAIMGTRCSEKMMLKDPGYHVLDDWTSESQIDLIVDCPKDRVCRIIECKWQKFTASMLHEVLGKACPTRGQILRCLIVSSLGNPKAVDEARDKGVVLVSLPDLFS